ncbi:MAG: UDP-N-acetylmuramoyl-L-alanine--D-glutamate ligase [Fusobacteriaceae bacterium]
MAKAMIYGGGLSGLSGKKLFEAMGKKCILVDDKIGINSLEAEYLLDEIDIFLKSPGISPKNSLVQKVKNKGIQIVDEIEIAYIYMKKNSPETKMIAVTGTNGKTTTTAKIAELLNYYGKKAIACGNIGKPFGEAVLENKGLDYVVVECSSFQLENINQFKADIALVINLAPDHLDRYENLDDYYDAKFNIGKNQGKNERFIINLEDIESLKRTNKIFGSILGISKERKKDAYIYIQDEKIKFYDEEIIEVKNLSLKGRHNLENMIFLIAVGKILEIDNETLKNYLMDAKPIEHRLESFFAIGKTVFINDSKGTNIDSTKFAVEAYSNPILICGGKDKKMNLFPLAKLIKDNVKELYLIGENRGLIKKELEKIEYSQDKIYDCENLENVMEELKRNIDLDSENIILFSPATSSFDQFKNFEERGRIFKEMVKSCFQDES